MSIESRVCCQDPALLQSRTGRHAAAVNNAFYRVAAGAILCLWGLAHAQPESADNAGLHQIDRKLASVAGETIRIVNRYGNVRIRALPDHARGSLRVTVQARSKDINPARLDVSRVDSGPVYEVMADSASDDFIRADLVVALPDRAGLDVVLKHGDFTMHPASYPVKLRARTGNVRLRTSGTVGVEVLEGRVIYHPPRGRSPEGGRIQTSGAPVNALLDQDVALNLHVVSGAAVTTDSLELLASRRRKGRAAVFGAQEDAATLEILTDHGPVRLVVEGHR